MAFIPVPDVVAVTLVWGSVSTFVGENTLYFKTTGLGAINGASMQQLMTDIQSAMLFPTDRAWSSAVYCTDLHARDLTTENSLVEDQTGSTATLGESTAALLPASNTIAVSLRTGLAGRSFRGRVYHCGLTEGEVTLNSLVAGVEADIVSLWSGIIFSSAITPEWEGVVVSRFSEGAPRTTGIATPITNVLLTDIRVDSQRRRLKHYA